MQLNAWKLAFPPQTEREVHSQRGSDRPEETALQVSRGVGYYLPIGESPKKPQTCSCETEPALNICQTQTIVKLIQRDLIKITQIPVEK